MCAQTHRQRHNEDKHLGGFQDPDRCSLRDRHIGINLTVISLGQAGVLARCHWDGLKKKKIIPSFCLIIRKRINKKTRIHKRERTHVRAVASLASSWWTAEAEPTLTDYSEQLGHWTVNYTQGNIITSPLLTTGGKQTDYMVTASFDQFHELIFIYRLIWYKLCHLLPNFDPIMCELYPKYNTVNKSKKKRFKLNIIYSHSSMWLPNILFGKTSNQSESTERSCCSCYE